jgi:hypothetical protein
MTTPRLAAAVGLLWWGCASVVAQNCDLAQPLNPALGFDAAPVTQAVFDEDGPGPNPARLYVGGAFERAGGNPAHHIARWDGSAWSPLGAGLMTSSVRTMRVFDDGNGLALFIGGVSGEAPLLERWDGAHWSAVALPTYPLRPYTAITAMVVFDPDGAGPLALCLHVAVEYGGDSGCTVVLVYRYDGSQIVQVGQVGTTEVRDLLPFDPDGPGPANPDLYLAGVTATTHDPCYNGGPVLARLRDGATSIIASGTPFEVYSSMVVFDADSAGPMLPRLYVGGKFDSIGGVPARRIAAWDGASWSAADAGLSADSQGILALTTFDPDGAGPQRRILVGVDARTPVSGTSVALISEFDGVAWTAAGPGLTGLFSLYQPFNLREFDPDAGGPALPLLSVVGEFNGVNGMAAARWVAVQGGALTGPSPGPAGPVNAMAVFNDGGGRSLFAAGSFAGAGAAPAANIARWDGTSWSALSTGVQPTPQAPAPVVRALAVHNDGSGWALYAAGSFGAAGGRTASNVARWNGHEWSPVGASGLSGGEVLALEVHDPDGIGPVPARLYAGGSFTTADGQPAARLAAWDGAAWSPVGGGVSGIVRALRSFDDGSGPALYVGGDVFTAGALPPNRAARWAGGQWSALPPIGDGRVDSFGIHDDGTGYALYIAGALGWGPSALQRSVGKLIGGQWRELASQPPDYPRVIRSIPEGGQLVLYAGGDDPVHPLVRYSQGTWTNVPPGTRGMIRAISPAFDDGHGSSVFVGGVFIDIGGEPASHLARVPACACYANCDGSTVPPVLNIADYFCFLQRFAAGDPYANCDGSIIPPILNVADFTCFQQRFAAGCP